jgi:hypothetical protein
MSVQKSGDNLKADFSNGVNANFRILTAGSVAQIGPSTASDVAFLSGNAEKMRMTSAGDLLVGTTSVNPGIGNANTGFSVTKAGGQVGHIAISQNGNYSANFNRNTSDGTVVQISKQGTVVGSIGVKDGNNLTIDSTASNHCGIEFDGGSYIPRRNSATADNLIDLGTTSTRFAHLYLGGGVFLGGTGTANELTDYEEGTWTPAATFANDTASGQNGQYTKIGNVVTATFNIVFSSTSFGVQISVSGLPFTSHNVSGSNSAGFGRQAYYDGTSTNLSLAVLNNSTQVDLYENATALQNNSDKILGKNLRATVVYRTA